MPRFLGTSGRDRLIGTAENDVLDGLGGDDLLYGAGGNDTLLGGAGEDLLQGGAGNDLIQGGAGFDFAVYWDAPGPVAVDLRLQGRAQNTGALGSDTLVGVEGLQGGAFGDRLIGDAANNTLIGWDGADRLIGLGGDDVFVGGAGADTMDGGAGFDTLSYWDAVGAVWVDMSTGRTQEFDSLGGLISTDEFIGMENVFAGDFADRVMGNGAANTLVGLGGADDLNGGDGDDILDGGSGADVLTGGLGADRFVYRGVSDSTALDPDNIDANPFQRDIVDLSAIDANTLMAGDQAFRWVNAPTGQAGDLWFFFTPRGPRFEVRGDVDGDGVADFAIWLSLSPGVPGLQDMFIL